MLPDSSLQTKTITTALLVAVILIAFTAGAGTVSANPLDTPGDDGVDDWCLTTSTSSGGSPEDVTNICGPSSAQSPHQVVQVSYVRSTSPTHPQVQTIIPTIKTDTREDVSIETNLVYEGSGEVYESNALGEVLEPVTDTTFLQSHTLEGTDRTSFVHRVQLEEGTVNPEDLRLEIEVYDESEQLVASMTGNDALPVGGFYVSAPAETEEDEDEEEDDTRQDATSSGVISSSDRTIAIQEQSNDISRFVDGSTEPRPLYDGSLPPTQYQGGSQTGWAVGSASNVDSLQTVEEDNVFEQGAVILSGNHPNRNTEAINFGTATYGIPQANDHYLSISYALAVANTNTSVEVKLTDSQGNPIDPNAETREFGHTMSSTLEDGTPINFSAREQFENAIEDDLLSTQTEEFELTPAETRYINNNYEAYITYAAEGESSLVLFRSAVVSTDQEGTIGQPIQVSPAYPTVGQDVEINSNLGTAYDDYENVQEVWTITDDVSGETLGYDSTSNGITTEFADSDSKTVQLEVIYDEDVSDEGEEADYVTRSDEYERTIQVQGVQDESATFDIYYEINENIDERFGTVNVEPETEELVVPVTVTNDGDTTVERDIVLLDTLTRDYGYTDRVMDERTVTVEPRSEKQVNLRVSWEAHEFGHHEINVVDGSGDTVDRIDASNPDTDVYVYQPATLEIENLDMPSTWLVENNFTSRVIVRNVGDLSTRHEASESIISSEFGEFWNGTQRDVELAGGDVREEQVGENREVIYDREGLRYSPLYPEITVNDREQVNSPYGTETGVWEYKAETLPVFMQSNQQLYESYIDEETQEVELYKMEILSTDLMMGSYNDVEPEFDEDVIGDESWYASAYPFTDRHWTTSEHWAVRDYFDRIEQVRDADTPVDFEDNNPDAIPTTDIEDIQGPIRQGGDDSEDRLFMRVSILNDGGDWTGNARVVVVSDQEIYYPADDFSPEQIPANRPLVNDEWETQTSEYYEQEYYSSNVAGMSSIHLDDNDSQEVFVPIVIPNHEQNKGEHTLTVQVRDTLADKPDYLERRSEVLDDDGEVIYEAPDHLFQHTVDIDVWGDSVLVETEQHQQSVNQLCDEIGLGDCDNEDAEEFSFDVTYKNMGGDNIDHTIDAHIYHTGGPVLDPTEHHLNRASGTDDHQDNSVPEGWYSGDRGSNQDYLTSDTTVGVGLTGSDWASDHESYWAQPVTEPIAPRDTHTWTFENIFERPGEYRVQLTQSRVNHETDQLEGYNHPEDQFDYTDNVELEVMVWDVMDPVAEWHTQDVTGREESPDSNDRHVELGTEYLDDEYAGLSSTATVGNYDVWEGGALRLDGQERWGWTPDEATNMDVSHDNVGIQDYNWTIDGADPNRFEIDGQAIHRFDGSYDREAHLQVWNYDEFTEGEGNQLTDTEFRDIQVRPDNDAPDLGIDYDVEHENTNNPGDYVWAGSPTDAGGYFTDVLWTVDGEDQAIGIEDGRWTIEEDGGANNKTGENSDLWQCRDFWIANNNPDVNTDAIDTYSQNYSSCTETNSYRGNQTIAADNATWDAVTEWQDRDDGTEGGVTTVTRFTATDFAGNESFIEDDIDVYVDRSDPTAFLENTNDDRSVDDRVWGAYSGQNYSGEQVAWDACDSYNNGPNNGGVGLHGSTNSNTGSDADTAFQFTAPPGTGWQDCTFVSDPYDAPASGGGTYSERIETEDVTVRDWYGNTETVSDSIRVIRDNVDPSYSCDPSDCHNSDSNLNNYSEDTTGSSSTAISSNRASATTCVTFNNDGYDGGVGLDDLSTSGDSTTTQTFNSETIEVCITANAHAYASASASASASPSASCSTPSSCGTCDSDFDWDTDRDDDSDDDYDDEYVEATVTVTDNHGNTSSETISAYAEADAEAYAEAYDFDTDSCEECSGDCPDDDDDSDDSDD